MRIDLLQLLACGRPDPTWTSECTDYISDTDLYVRKLMYKEMVQRCECSPYIERCYPNLDFDPVTKYYICNETTSKDCKAWAAELFKFWTKAPNKDTVCAKYYIEQQKLAASCV